MKCITHVDRLLADGAHRNTHQDKDESVSHTVQQGSKKRTQEPKTIGEEREPTKLRVPAKRSTQQGLMASWYHARLVGRHSNVSIVFALPPLRLIPVPLPESSIMKHMTVKTTRDTVLEVTTSGQFNWISCAPNQMSIFYRSGFMYVFHSAGWANPSKLSK